MTKRAETINLQGKDYATVAERIRLFREDSPKGSIETSYEIVENNIIFKTTVSKDRSDESSARATGHAMGENKGAKAFEKLESISVGRSLALLGYLASGAIASSEEMEEFLNYQSEKENKLLEEAQNALEGVKNMDELKKVWSAMPINAKNKLSDLKDKIKGGFNGS